jgi:hypothetical protein
MSHTFTSSVPIKLEPTKEVGRITIILEQSEDGFQCGLSIKKEGDISGIARIVVYGPNPGYTGPGGVEVPPSEFQWAEFSQAILDKLNTKPNALLEKIPS